MTGFGKLLRLMRTAADESLEEIGEVVGMTRAAISRYELTNVTSPPFDVVYKIAQHYRLRPELIMQASMLAETQDGYIELRKVIREGIGGTISKYASIWDSPIDLMEERL